MPGFENYAQEARDVEREIARLGIALGIDWDDVVAVRLLAREALACRASGDAAALERCDRIKVDLFGLAQLMLKIMQESAQERMHTHGGAVWKAFARALWAEAESQGLVSERRHAPRPEAP